MRHDNEIRKAGSCVNFDIHIVTFIPSKSILIYDRNSRNLVKSVESLGEEGSIEKIFYQIWDIRNEKNILILFDD